ncbi:MAG: hypothetical protein GDA38_23020 [Hormoscilla sp. SP12CHS1]|nr:hypothetical protein [Hormoscilla sp. SP12CHS1]
MDLTMFLFALSRTIASGIVSIPRKRKNCTTADGLGYVWGDRQSAITTDMFLPSAISLAF